MAKSRVRYGARSLPNGAWGIVVDIFHKDGNVTKDRNTMPYRSRGDALSAAKRMAINTANDEGITDIKGDVE